MRVVDVLLREGYAEVPGSAFLVEVNAENLATGKGNFVESEDGVGGTANALLSEISRKSMSSL